MAGDVATTGIAAADIGLPAGFDTAFGELVENALLAPDPVAPRAKPLRPIIGPSRAHGESKDGDDKEKASFQMLHRNGSVIPGAYVILGIDVGELSSLKYSWIVSLDGLHARR